MYQQDANQLFKTLKGYQAPNNDKPIIVRVSGFDETDDYEDIKRVFTRNRNCIVMKNTINNGDIFKGIVFVSFRKQKDADKFLKEKNSYKGKKLCCLVSNGYNETIQEGQRILRTPRFIFAKWIPKTYKKEEVQKVFQHYGEIEELILHNLPTRKDYTATIKYYEQEDAQNCADANLILLGNRDRAEASQYFPGFTDQMLKKVHPDLRKYIRQVKLNKDFKFQVFRDLEDQIISNGPHNKKFIFSNLENVNNIQNKLSTSKQNQGNLKASSINNPEQKVKDEKFFYKKRPDEVNMMQNKSNYCSDSTAPSNQYQINDQNQLYYPRTAYNDTGYEKNYLQTQENYHQQDQKVLHNNDQYYANSNYNQSDWSAQNYLHEPSNNYTNNMPTKSYYGNNLTDYQHNFAYNYEMQNCGFSPHQNNQSYQTSDLYANNNPNFGKNVYYNQEKFDNNASELDCNSGQQYYTQNNYWYRPDQIETNPPTENLNSNDRIYDYDYFENQHKSNNQNYDQTNQVQGQENITKHQQNH